MELLEGVRFRPMRDESVWTESTTTCAVVNQRSVIRRISVFSARCKIYLSRLCYVASVRLSVHLSVTELHWRIIANWGFKFRSHFTALFGRRAAGGCRAARCAAGQALCVTGVTQKMASREIIIICILYLIVSPYCVENIIKIGRWVLKI